MKKLFYLLLILPIVLMSSCSDDELPTTLSGTSWVYSVSVLGMSTSLTYDFTTETDYVFVLNVNDTPIETRGVYTYDASNGAVVLDKGTVQEQNGTIKGNKFTISVEDMGSIKLTKK